MKTTARWAALAASGALTLAAVVVPLVTARAQSPSAKPAASASASAPTRPAEPVPFEEVTIPTESSARPTLEEWKTATRVVISRRSVQGRRCRASVVREWLKINCSGFYAGVRQYVGNPEGVLLWAHEWRSVEDQGAAEAILQMRPGDRRIVQFFDLDLDYGWAGSSPGFVVDELWLDGQSRPRVVLR